MDAEKHVYFELLNATPLMFFWKSTNFTYQGANKKFLDFMGFPDVSNLLGKTSSQLPCNSNIAEFLDTDDLKIIETGLPSLDIQSELQPTGKQLSLSKYPLVDDHNNIIGIYGIINSVESKNIDIYLENLIETLPYFIFWKDANFIYRGCNRKFAALVNAEPIEVIGKTDFELSWGPGEAELYHQGDMDVLKGNPVVNREEVVKDSDGNIATMLVNKRALYNKDQQCVGILGASIDISDRKIMETNLKISKEKAEIASHAKSEFIANMSHDIRTPIAGLIGMAKMLEDEGDSERDREYAHIIHTSSERLLTLVNDILDVITADEARGEQLKLESLKLQDRIQYLKELVLPNFKGKNVSFEIHVDPRLTYYVLADRIKIDRVLLNLFSNALKFTTEGTISCSVKQLERNNDDVLIEICINDTGIGIEEDKIDKIFDLFFKASPSFMNKYKGHGIGLFIVQKYILLMHGTIKVESELNKGTTFRITLPMKIGDERDVQNFQDIDLNLSAFATEDIKHISEKIDNRKISTTKEQLSLLIEDNDVARKIAKRTLEKSGFRVDDVADAETGLKHALDRPYDFIITDIGLPGMDGHQFSRVFRAWEQATNHSRIPIVGLSAHGAKEKEKALYSGMDDLLEKPISDEKLKTIIQRFFDKQKDETLKIVETNDKTSLGVDLPEIEAELFNLENYPLLDEKNGIETAGGNKEFLKELITILAAETIPTELKVLTNAHQNADWMLIQKTAHKLKGGSLYCGTIRMKFACQYMERYRLAGHIKYLEELYQQLIKVMNDTLQKIHEWLKSN